MAWRVRVGDREFEVEPLMDDAELDSRSSTGTIYWEGPVRLRAADGGPAGSGYLELTGYAGRLDAVENRRGHSPIFPQGK